VTDRISNEHRSWNKSCIRGRDTKPELLLRSILHEAGYRFRLHAHSLLGKPDIVLPKYQAVIFVHGCFWHRHGGYPNSTIPKSRTDFRQDKFRRTVERDQVKQKELETLALGVLKVWECELRSDPAEVLKTI